MANCRSILDSGSPLYDYEPNTWGPRQAEDIAKGVGPWHDPAAAKQAIGPDRRQASAKKSLAMPPTQVSRSHGKQPAILVIDIGGTHVKLSA